MAVYRLPFINGKVSLWILPKLSTLVNFRPRWVNCSLITVMQKPLATVLLTMALSSGRGKSRMDQEAYQQYRAYKEQGRKAEAKAALEMFLASVGPAEARREWVEAFLERGEFGHRIRHEIYERLVFPVLLQGYERDEVWSLRWLARTADNLYRAPALHALVGFKSKRQFLAQAYAQEPTEEIRRLLLEARLREFEYSQHEWPAGILYGMDGATLAECDEIRNEIAFARELDEGRHAEFLDAFEGKVNEYRARLLAASGSPSTRACS